MCLQNSPGFTGSVNNEGFCWDVIQDSSKYTIKVKELVNEKIVSLACDYMYIIEILLFDIKRKKGTTSIRIYLEDKHIKDITRRTSTRTCKSKYYKRAIDKV